MFNIYKKYIYRREEITWKLVMVTTKSIFNMSGRRQNAAKQTQDAAHGSSLPAPKGKAKQLQKTNEKTITEIDSENDTSSAGEEAEGWWRAGKKGKRLRR